MEEIKKEPKPKQSRFKISPLANSPTGDSMMFIEDNEGKMPSMAISHKDAMKKFAIQTVNAKIGNSVYPMPHPKYSNTDLELANQVNGYLVSINSVPKTQVAAQPAKPAEKKKYAYSKEYYAQKRRESRMRARSDAKKVGNQ